MTTVTTRNVTTTVATTVKQGISDDADWLQAMQEHRQVVADQVASHHDDQGQSTFRGSHPGSECRNAKRHAALEEGDPREEPAQKKVKVEAPAEQPVEKSGEPELLLCQCSQTVRLIVLQEREDFQGRWTPGWCHHCIKPAPWMNMQPNSQDEAKANTLNIEI